MYRRSAGYDGLDLRCFEVTNAPHKNKKDDNVAAVKLDFVIRITVSFIQLLWAYWPLVICIVSDANNYERTITKFQSRGTAFMKFQLAQKFGLHRV